MCIRIAPMKADRHATPGQADQEDNQWFEAGRHGGDLNRFVNGNQLFEIKCVVDMHVSILMIMLIRSALEYGL